MRVGLSIKFFCILKYYIDFGPVQKQLRKNSSIPLSKYCMYTGVYRRTSKNFFKIQALNFAHARKVQFVKRTLFGKM